MQSPVTNAEQRRLQEDRTGTQAWKQWGPYLSERQWGTVREDYSRDGNAWEYFPHNMARMRAYRWGEDGLAGISDDQQQLCLALALWNGRDPFLKERLFGLANAQGNHGEDVKELYYYLDATPTHSWLKMLYKYPQQEFPYRQLIEENARRSKSETEFELIDTGCFDQDRYFDVFVEYAKAAPDDILMHVRAYNRGPQTAPLHLLPQLWFRNTWSWTLDAHRPTLDALGESTVCASHAALGTWHLYVDGHPALLFCDNDTNTQRLGYTTAEHNEFCKDAFHDYVVDGRRAAVNSRQSGTKAAAHYQLEIPPGESRQIRIRLCRGQRAETNADRFHDFAAVMEKRAREADEFYDSLQKNISSADARNVHRQALAGMIWTKQFYYFDIPRWLEGDPAQPAPPRERLSGRNTDWDHLNNADILSMPDSWEYPWYAAWDLAFHCITFVLIDADFAKDQLVRLTREWYMHPNGQLPAYEWNFSDVNPPVHAWATLRVFQMDREQRGDKGDLQFLERVFHKLLLNFTWWVNRKDAEGRNIFHGGFLGLDNIGVFDRSKPLPTGGHMNQADGTAWMAMYCLNMMHIALQLALSHNRVYEDIATKFFEHFLYVAQAMEKRILDKGLWSEQDGFFYDVLSLPDGKRIPLQSRSMVGLIPLFAIEVLDNKYAEHLPGFAARLRWFLNYRPDLASLVSRWSEPGQHKRILLSLLRGHRMKCLLQRMLDETRFLSDYGIRSMSRQHAGEPYEFHIDGQVYRVSYEPGESESGLFGGNSNWRGPVWLPVNYLIIESLHRFHHYYGDDFSIEYPVNSGQYLNLKQVADELTRRLSRLFLRDEQGNRACYGDCLKFQQDPHFRDHLLFHEYFHGDNGRGLGACHQTGWTGLIANLLQHACGAAIDTGSKYSMKHSA